VPVVFVIGDLDREALERALDADPLGFISKPLRPANIQGPLALCMKRLAQARKAHRCAERIRASMDTILRAGMSGFGEEGLYQAPNGVGGSNDEALFTIFHAKQSSGEGPGRLVPVIMINWKTLKLLSVWDWRRLVKTLIVIGLVFSWFLCWAHHDFADKTVGFLRQNHANRMGNIPGLEHPLTRLSFFVLGRKRRIGGSGANHGYANSVFPHLFGQ